MSPVDICAFLLGMFLDMRLLGQKAGTVLAFLGVVESLLQSGRDGLHSPQKGVRVADAPYPCQHLAFSVLLVLAF